MKLIKKVEARQILKNVNREQFVEDFESGDFYSYSEISMVTRSTDKALFISTPSHPNCKDGFWLPKSACRFSFETRRSDESMVRVSIQYNDRYTNWKKDKVKNGGISTASAIANFITRTGGDIYCTA